MATAKKAAPAKTTKKATKPAAEDDDLLSTKAKKPAAKKAKGDDDLLSTKKAAKPAAKKAAPAKAKAEDDGTTGTRDDVRAVLLKTKKATSFADIATANNFNVRMVRRTARALKADGLVEITREGTTGMVRKVAG